MLVDHVHVVVEIEGRKAEVVTQTPLKRGLLPERRKSCREARVVLASPRVTGINPLTGARVDRPLIELSHPGDLWRRQTGRRVGWTARALQRSGIPMAIPRVGQVIVQAQSAILADALLDDRASDRGRLVQRDRGRAIEGLKVPEVVRAPWVTFIKG